MPWIFLSNSSSAFCKVGSFEDRHEGRHQTNVLCKTIVLMPGKIAPLKSRWEIYPWKLIRGLIVINCFTLFAWLADFNKIWIFTETLLYSLRSRRHPTHGFLSRIIMEILNNSQNSGALNGFHTYVTRHRCRTSVTNSNETNSERLTD